MTFDLSKLGYRVVKDDFFKDEDGSVVFKKEVKKGVYIIQVDRYGYRKTFDYTHTIPVKWLEWVALNIDMYNRFSLIENL